MSFHTFVYEIVPKLWISKAHGQILVSLPANKKPPLEWGGRLMSRRGLFASAEVSVATAKTADRDICATDGELVVPASLRGGGFDGVICNALPRSVA